MEGLRKEYTKELAKYVSQVELVLTNYINLATASKYKEADDNIKVAEGLQVYLKENKHNDDWVALLDYLGEILKSCETKKVKVEDIDKRVDAGWKTEGTSVYEMRPVKEVNQLRDELKSVVVSGYLKIAKIETDRTVDLEKKVAPLAKKNAELEAEISKMKKEHPEALEQQKNKIQKEIRRAKREVRKTNQRVVAKVRC